MPPPPWRKLVRILLVGAGLALLVFAIGRLAEFIALGPSDEVARARVEAGVRADFDRMSRALRVMALGVADPVSVVAASRDDVTATRRLFAAAEAALAPVDVADFALTAYGEDGRPLAWDGRPSDLPADRLQGEEAWFLAQGALGLRLVYVTPVVLPNGPRVGAVAAERSLALGSASRDSVDAFRYAGPIASVSISLRFEGGPTTPTAAAFDVMTPSGGLLFTATLDAAELAQTRTRWRRASASLALITLGLALALLAVPLLDWRARLTEPGPALTALVCATVAIAVGRAFLTWGSPARWSEHSLFSGSDYSSLAFSPLLSSPYEFFVSAVAAAGLVALLLSGVEGWRLRRRRRRPTAILVFVLAQLSAGVWLATLLVAYQAFLRNTVDSTTLDLLHFSLHPLSTSRLALHIGLIAWHASALGCGVLVLRAASAAWAVSRTDWRFRTARIILWTLPLLAYLLATSAVAGRPAPSTHGRCGGDRSRLLHQSCHRTLPSWFAGVPAHDDDPRAGGPGDGLLPLALPARMAGQGASRGNAVRATGARPTTDDSAPSAGELEPNRSISRVGGTDEHPAGASRNRSPDRPRLPAVASNRTCDVPGDVVGRALRGRRIADLSVSRSICLTISPPRHRSTTRPARGTSTKKCHRSSPRSDASCTPVEPSAMPTVVRSGQSSRTRCSTMRTCRSSCRRARTSS